MTAIVKALVQFNELVKSIGCTAVMDDYEKRRLGIFNRINVTFDQTIKYGLHDFNPSILREPKQHTKQSNHRDLFFKGLDLN